LIAHDKNVTPARGALINPRAVGDFFVAGANAPII
jgi:hypothetical protein